MEIDKLFGLPAHPLLVHLPVVLLPLAAIGALVLVFFPRYMPRLGWLVLTIAGVGTLGAFFAAGSGETLEETLRAAGEEPSPKLERHTELGDQTRIVALVFFLLLAALVVFSWWRRKVGEEQAVAKTKNPKAIAIVLSVLVVVSAGLSTWWIVETGHNGAAATWEDVGTGG
jgi:uncharacterized membrane protein